MMQQSSPFLLEIQQQIQTDGQHPTLRQFPHRRHNRIPFYLAPMHDREHALNRWTTTPVIPSFSQDIFCFEIKRASYWYSVNSRMANIDAQPFRYPALAWIHHGCLSLEKGSRIRTTFVIIFKHAEEGTIFTTIIIELRIRFENTTSFACLYSAKIFLVGYRRIGQIRNPLRYSVIFVGVHWSRVCDDCFVEL